MLFLSQKPSPVEMIIKVVHLSVEEVEAHTHKVDGQLRFISSNDPRTEGKSSYSGLLRQKLESALECADPVDFKIRQSFKSNKKGSRFTCYPTCSHGNSHAVFYNVSDLRANSALSMTWKVKCLSCYSLPVTLENLPVISKPSTTSEAILTDASRAQENFDLFRAVRELVNAQLDEQEQTLSESSDPLQELLNSAAHGMLEVATAYKKGVEAARLYQQNIQLLSKATIIIETLPEVHAESLFDQVIDKVQETASEVQESVPEAQEVRVELPEVVLEAQEIQGELQVSTQDTLRSKRTRNMSQKALEMLENKRRKNH